MRLEYVKCIQKLSLVPLCKLQAQYLSCFQTWERGNAQISRQLMIAHVPSAALDRKSCWRTPTQTSSEVIRIVINSIRIDFLVIDSLRSLSELFPNARFGRVKPGTQPNSFHLLSDDFFWTGWTGILKQKTFGANQSTITLYGPVDIFCRFDAVHLRRCLNREISDCGKVVASWRNWAKLLSDGAWRAWLKGVWRHGDIQRASHMCFIKVEVQASFLWNSWDLHIWKISGQVFQYLELVSSWNHWCHLQENLDNDGVF